MKVYVAEKLRRDHCDGDYEAHESKALVVVCYSRERGEPRVETSIVSEHEKGALIARRVAEDLNLREANEERRA